MSFKKKISINIPVNKIKKTLEDRPPSEFKNPIVRRGKPTSAADRPLKTAEFLEKDRRLIFSGLFKLGISQHKFHSATPYRGFEEAKAVIVEQRYRLIPPVTQLLTLT